MKNSTILRRAALGPAPNVHQERAASWLPYGLALLAVYALYPSRRRHSAGFAFRSMSEPEIRLSLLFVAAAEEAEGR